MKKEKKTKDIVVLIVMVAILCLTIILFAWRPWILDNIEYQKQEFIDSCQEKCDELDSFYKEIYVNVLSNSSEEWECVCKESDFEDINLSGWENV